MLDCNLHIYFIQFTFFSEEFLSYGYGNPSHCGTDCKFLSDGFGYWMNGSWKAHAPGKAYYLRITGFFLISIFGSKSTFNSLSVNVVLCSKI